MENVVVLRQILFDTITVEEGGGILSGEPVLVFVTLYAKGYKEKNIRVSFTHSAKLSIFTESPQKSFRCLN